MNCAGLILTVGTVLSVIVGAQSASVANNSTNTQHNIILEPSHPPCKSNQYLDTDMDPPSCRLCTVCPTGLHEISECTKTADTICRHCPKGQVMSELEAFCRPCGCCSGKPYNHQVQNDCLAAGLPVHRACMADGPCPPETSTPVSTVPPANTTEVTNTTAAAMIQGHKENTTAVLMGLLLGTVVVLVCLGLFLYCRKKSKRKNPQTLAVIYKRERFPEAETQPAEREELAIGAPVDPDSNMDYYHGSQPFI